MPNRVLNRRGARELTPEEVSRVSGGTFHLTRGCFPANPGQADDMDPDL